MPTEKNSISNDELTSALLQPMSPSQQHEQPVKIRKKPGRKPNPASPSLRKAQNRAAQRAFRERKERYLREMEDTIKQLRAQRDKLHTENDRLKKGSDILRSENWYLKGIALTLQLVCFRHNLVIPQHSPCMNEEALGILAQSIPQPIAAYINVNANNKVPLPTRFFSDSPEPRKQHDQFLSSGSIIVAKDGIQKMSKRQTPNLCDIVSNNGRRRISMSISKSYSSQDEPDLQPTSLPALSPVPSPITLPPQSNDIVTSNLAAIQILRLRLLLQSVCHKADAQHFAIQPTALQLTIPHDPRIDLIPTPHMRDRMILFRDLFDLDECLSILTGNATFHGGDPAVPSNWQLPAEFFDKFWFLTTDFSLKRITNEWDKADGLNELEPTEHMSDMPDLTHFSFPPPLQQQQKQAPVAAPPSLPDTEISISSGSSDIFSSPIQLTDGHISKVDEVAKDTMAMDIFPPWDKEFVTPVEHDYDTLMESLINTDHV